MIVVIHVDRHYDWEPLPEGVTPTAKDVQARRVKPDSGGKWLMRVTRTADTHTTVSLPEHEVVALAIGDMIRDRTPVTRSRAVALYLSRHVTPHHAHRDWMTKVEVSDDGPDEDLFRRLVGAQVEAGNLETEDVESMLDAYLAPAREDHGLHDHFEIEESKETRRASSETTELTSSDVRTVDVKTFGGGR